MQPPDTIFALSSGRPPAGVAVVRLSGPGALPALAKLAGAVPAARIATLAALRDSSSALLDRAVVLAFPAPHSFTGEDVAELQVHGGAAVIAAVLGALERIEGLRLAEPGEFSRRAFDNGKLDLSQAEGLADLIAAESEAQRRQALAQAGGRLRDRAEDWRLRLLALQAGAEAGLDFADEGDVDDDEADSEDANRLAGEIGTALDDGGLGERLREGFTVAVVGPPNAGKSSIINALSRKDAAIVTAIAGTTRDVIEVPVVIGGVPVTLLDTAGIRESLDPIEAEGIRRARARAAAADLVLSVVDGETGASVVVDGPVMSVVNKADLGRRGATDDSVVVSAATGEGVEDLRVALVRWAEGVGKRAESALITQARHRTALTDCVEALRDAAETGDAVLRAEYFRRAGAALGWITGRLRAEDMLDSLFGRFCIGK